MSNYATAGLVATTPRHLITQDGMAITTFRLAAPHIKANGEEETNWFTITGFGDVAINMAGSINKGERVMVMGELRVRDWDNGERAGTSVEIEVSAIGHDLSYGTAQFLRTVLKKRTPKEQAAGISAAVDY
jgi:single-strand DNA-binding protein